MKCAVLVAAAVLASVSFAQGFGPGMAPVGPVLRAATNPKVAEKLGLSAEQVEKIKALAEEKDELKALNEKVRKGTQRQAELLKAEKIDEAAVMAALDEVWEARKEVAKYQTKRIIAVRTILTPEQMQKIGETMKEMRGEHRRGPRPEGRGRKSGEKKSPPPEA